MNLGAPKKTFLPPNLPVDQKAGFKIVGPFYLRKWSESFTMHLSHLHYSWNLSTDLLSLTFGRSEKVRLLCWHKGPVWCQMVPRTCADLLSTNLFGSNEVGWVGKEGKRDDWVVVLFYWVRRCDEHEKYKLSPQIKMQQQTCRNWTASSIDWKF